MHTINRVLVFLILCSLFLRGEAAIKAVVFDFGDVMAHTDQVAITTFIQESLHLSKEELKKGICLWRNDQDEITERFWERYLQCLGKEEPKGWNQELFRTVEEAIHPIPGMFELVANLKRSGYVVGLLSNTFPAHARFLKAFGYYKPFQPLLLSYEIGYSKPDCMAYQTLIETLNLAPNEILFVDDRPDNVRAARAHGIEGIVFKGYENLIIELSHYDVQSESRKDRLLFPTVAPGI